MSAVLRHLICMGCYCSIESCTCPPVPKPEPVTIDPTKVVPETAVPDISEADLAFANKVIDDFVKADWWETTINYAYNCPMVALSREDLQALVCEVAAALVEKQGGTS